MFAICTYPSRTQQGYIPCGFEQLWHRHIFIWETTVMVTADKIENSLLKPLIQIGTVLQWLEYNCEEAIRLNAGPIMFKTSSSLILGVSCNKNSNSEHTILPPQTNYPMSHLATSLCFAAVAAAPLMSLLHGSRQEAYFKSQMSQTPTTLSRAYVTNLKTMQCLPLVSLLDEVIVSM